MIGKREELVLMALLRVSDEMCGAFPKDVHDYLCQKLGRSFHISATYTTLMRMERKGMVHLTMVDDRKVFTVSGEGHEALEANLAATEALRKPLSERPSVKRAVADVLTHIHRNACYPEMMAHEIGIGVNMILEVVK